MVERTRDGVGLLFVDDTPCRYETADDTAGAERAGGEDTSENMDGEGEERGDGGGGEVCCEEGAAADVFVY